MISGLPPGTLSAQADFFKEEITMEVDIDLVSVLGRLFRPAGGRETLGECGDGLAEIGG